MALGIESYPWSQMAAAAPMLRAFEKKEPSVQRQKESLSEWVRSYECTVKSESPLLNKGSLMKAEAGIWYRSRSSGSSAISW